jgi:hypothetical protein
VHGANASTAKPTAANTKYELIQEAGRTDHEKDIRYKNCTMFFFALE